MRQVIALLDINRTGFISRGEFATVIKNLEGGISLEETRLLMHFFDDKNNGKISVVELVKALQEIMN
jgi:Ca2+-binding EF-hand superfamily protein